MATHSSILAWGIPRTEEPVGLQSMGSQGQNLQTGQCGLWTEFEVEGRWGLSALPNSVGD